MFWMIAITAVSAAVTVGMGVASIVTSKNQSDETVKNQGKQNLIAAYVSYGEALNTAPSAVPI